MLEHLRRRCVSIARYVTHHAQALNNIFASRSTGIGPEAFAYISSDGNFTGGDPITPEQLAFYNKHGYYITSSDYIQRPEVLESNFYAFRATGDTKYLDRAASAVRSFNTFLKTPGGFACLNDVNNVTAPLLDAGESFWYAEVLKYLYVVSLCSRSGIFLTWLCANRYLTFDDPNHISLDKCA